MTSACNKIRYHESLCFLLTTDMFSRIFCFELVYRLEEGWQYLWPSGCRSKSTKLFFPPHVRLIRCNLKSKIPDSTFSDAIACMFCMAVWIKDWLSLLLSCSNLCPLSLQEGSGEFPKQSGLTFPGRYRLPHFNEWKCKAKLNIKSEWIRQPIPRVIIRIP